MSGACVSGKWKLFYSFLFSFVEASPLIIGLLYSNVQVTLGILAALIEKSPKDVTLIAPCVLKILDLILRSNDITMIESSLPTFEALCEHHDPSSLFGDQVYLQQYESVVREYAQLASTRPQPNKGDLSRSVQLRWRNAGLSAIKSIAASDALASTSGRQIDVIVPLILENLWTDSVEWLETLLRRIQEEEKVDADRMLRRRTSVGTVGTADTGGNDAAVFTESALDADKLAEEDTGVLALQCLKSIFIVPNRPQIHGATAALLKFIFDRIGQGDSVVTLGQDRKNDSGWALTIYNFICRWAPVQDRYVILVVAMDTLIRDPTKEDKIDQQLSLVAIIGSLLRSDVNLIGLSVMDVLLGFIRQMRKLLHPGAPSRNETTVNEKTDTDVVVEPTTPRRKELLTRLEECIGDIATHVYYADQITDMITAILTRLKPSRPSNTGTPQPEKNESTEVVASTLDPSESQINLDAYFSHNQGRVSALKVIKGILLVANPKRKMSGNMDLSRNRVPAHVWEGTYWLLRDTDGQVRKAYVDALTTWLDRETTPADSKARSETMVQSRSALHQGRDFSHATTRRAVSNASARERPLRGGRRSHFLPLLHIAIYDNALQYFDYESDLAMLHVLLTKLVFCLGVNSVRYGIPMIYRLQEDIQDIDLPVHKVRIAALCHGYFWALTEKFDLDGSVAGRAITNEVIRRREKGFWVDGINVPCPEIQDIGMPGQVGPAPSWDPASLEKEALLPFDDRTALVECISHAYTESARSPSTSPAVSPNRKMTQPILGSTMTNLALDDQVDLPSSFREQMLTEWSREAAAAALAADSKAESLNGSKAGTTKSRNRLTIHTAGVESNGADLGSPFTGSPRHSARPHSARAPGTRDNAASVRARRTSVKSGFASPPTMFPSKGIASVEQLKMVLSGDANSNALGLRSSAGDDEEGSSGDSMVSYESPSELSFNPPGTQQSDGSPGSGLKRTSSTSRGGPLGSNPAQNNAGKPEFGEDGAPLSPKNDNGVPPVPPLPRSGASSTVPEDDIAVQDYASKAAPKGRTGSRAGNSLRVRRSSRAATTSTGAHDGEDGKAMDLQELLRGIDSHSGEGSLGNVTRPPY